MTEKKRQVIGTIGLIAGLVVLMFIGMLTALHAVGTDAALYHLEQTKVWTALDMPMPAGLSDDDLRRLDSALADYLSGDAEALLEGRDAASGVIQVSVWGQRMPAFNDREMAHLEDCFDLFGLLRRVRARLIPWAVLLGVGGAYLLQNRRRIRRAAWIAPLILLVPLGAFAAWAAIDFDEAFTFFHRLLFTNDLWLLDPATDLLICICPSGMFMDMGLYIALWSLAILIGVPLLVTLLTHIWPRGREVNTWNDRDTRRAAAQKRISFDRRGTR